MGDSGVARRQVPGHQDPSAVHQGLASTVTHICVTVIHLYLYTLRH